MKIKKFWVLINGHEFFMIGIILLTIVQTLLGFVLPIVVSSSVNQNFDVYKYLYLSVILLIILFVNLAITQIKKKSLVSFKQKLNAEWYDKLLKVNYARYNEQGYVYYLERIAIAIENYSDYILTTLPSLISAVVGILISFILIGEISLVIVIILIVLMIIQYFGYKVLNKNLATKSVQLQDVCAKGYENIYSFFQNADFIKQYGKYNTIDTHLKNETFKIHDITTEINTYAANFYYVLNSVITNIQYIMYLILGVLVIGRRITTSDFLFCIMTIGICFNGFDSLVRLNISTKDVRASMDFITNELDKYQENSGKKIIDKIDKIQFHNSTLKYGEKVLVNPFDLEIKKGDIVFLDGETGIGKSSLAKTLLGYVDIDGLSLNDIDFKELDLSSVRNKIKYISQNNSVYNATLTENVILQNNANNSYLKLRFFDKFIQNKQLENVTLNSNGSNLSGGDKQKIALARLITNDEKCDVVILDEATSSMDSETSKLALKETIKIYKNAIIIIISHSDELKQFANRVITIKDKAIQ